MKVLQLAFLPYRRNLERRSWLDWVLKANKAYNQRSVSKLVQCTNKLRTVLHVTDAKPRHHTIVLAVGKYLLRVDAATKYQKDLEDLRVTLDMAAVALWKIERTDYADEAEFIRKNADIASTFMDTTLALTVWDSKKEKFKGNLGRMSHLMNKSELCKFQFKPHLTAAMATFMQHFITSVYEKHVVSTRTATREVLLNCDTIINQEIARLNASHHLAGSRVIQMEFASQVLAPTVLSLTDEKSLRETVAIRTALGTDCVVLPFMELFRPFSSRVADFKVDPEFRAPIEAAREKLNEGLLATPPTSASHFLQVLEKKRKVCTEVEGLGNIFTTTKIVLHVRIWARPTAQPLQRAELFGCCTFVPRIPI